MKNCEKNGERCFDCHRVTKIVVLVLQESLKKVDLSKDEMIASLKVEKEGLITQREERKKEVEKLKAEISKVNKRNQQ